MTRSIQCRCGAAAVGAVLAGLLASCGGGGGTTTPAPPNTIGNGSNQVPGHDFDGPNQYDGNQQPTFPNNPGGGGTDPVTPGTAPFIYSNIFSVPITTNGQGKIVATTLSADGTGRLGFLPGQKVAVVMVNTNHSFLDAHYDDGSKQFPVLPQSQYSFTADLVARGASSMAGPEAIAAATRQDLGSTAGYNGLLSTQGAPLNPAVLYERGAISQGETPYSVQPAVKTVSLIQKGEIRSFVNVQPTITPPPVGPDPNNPQRPLDGMVYPYEYRSSQDGRLVAIGAHCLIFLSREINDGKPDTIQYTEARLSRLAQEFDTKIFPTTQGAFGPVKDYNEGNIFRDLDRSIVLDGSDFDNSDPPKLLPQSELPGTVDTAISDEHRIIIFLFHQNSGPAAGFYSPGLSQASIQALQEEGRSNDIAKFQASGSTLYVDASNFPSNDDAWTSAYSILAHEFQHKLYHDNNLPDRPTDPNTSNFNWFNEGMSQMSIHVNGYTVNSGRIVPWAINGQLTDYLKSINVTPIPVDGNTQTNTLAQYGGGFLFFLYLFEHYDPGVGNRIYNSAKQGETSYIKMIEAGAQQTYRDAGPDATLFTGDDTFKTFHDSFDELYSKYAIANFIDGIYTANDNALFDPRFHYNTIDLKGTVNLSNGTIVLPGVRTGVYPNGGSYPVTDIHRDLRPYCSDYLVFTNGDSTGTNVRDLSLTVFTDPNMRMFMLPVNYNSAQNAAAIVPGITIPTN
jgi:hypothetical protein